MNSSLSPFQVKNWRISYSGFSRRGRRLLTKGHAEAEVAAIMEQQEQQWQDMGLEPVHDKQNSEA